jgi:hypothetical protein
LNGFLKNIGLGSRSIVFFIDFLLGVFDLDKFLNKKSYRFFFGMDAGGAGTCFEKT